MKPGLAPGIEHELHFTVGLNKTVPVLYPEAPEFQQMPEVFATGYFVGFLEWACIQAINPYLDWPAEQTVGTHIDVSHCAATPAGMSVRARVRLIEVDGRRLRFEVEAHDGLELIGKGTHERFVIDRERFVRKAGGKAAQAKGG